MNPGPCFDHGDCERRIADLEAQLAAEKAQTDRLKAVLHAAGLSPGLIACEACEQAYLPAEQTSQGCPWCRLMFAQDVAAEAKARADAAESLASDVCDLVDESSHWLNDSTEWDGDKKLGPKWQALYGRFRAPNKAPAVNEQAKAADARAEAAEAKVEHYAHLAGAREREGRHRAEAAEARVAMLEEALRIARGYVEDRIYHMTLGWGDREDSLSRQNLALIDTALDAKAGSG